MENADGVSRRIVEVRGALGLTQKEFAEELQLSRTHISSMELNTRKVPDRLISLISFTYGVRETWLKTGRGTMFNQGRDDKLDEVIRNFKKLDDLLQDYVLKQIRLTLEYQENKKNNGG